MKRLVLLVMVFIMAFALPVALAACADNGGGEKDNASSSGTPPEMSSETLSEEPVGVVEKILVIYFSCTGNTKAVAEQIAELAGADLYEIIAADPYTTEDLDYDNDECRANVEANDETARPEIGGEAVDVSDYDTIFIGYPIWWGTMPRIINTFLDTYDLSGKVVMPFCTSRGSSVSKSVADIKNEEPRADVRDGLRAGGSDDEGIESWLSDNGII